MSFWEDFTGRIPLLSAADCSLWSEHQFTRSGWKFAHASGAILSVRHLLAMKGSRGGNPSKRAANGSKTTPKSSAPELSAAGSGSGLPSQGSSEDPFPIGECPYGLVGNIAKVPGTWWGGFYKGDDRKKHPSLTTTLSSSLAKENTRLGS